MRFLESPTYDALNRMTPKSIQLDKRNKPRPSSRLVATSTIPLRLRILKMLQIAGMATRLVSKQSSDYRISLLDLMGLSSRSA